MIGLNTPSSDKLKLYIDKLEHIEDEKHELTEQAADILKQAKNDGFDTKIIRKIIRIRKIPIEDHLEQEELLDTYLHALGMKLTSE